MVVLPSCPVLPKDACPLSFLVLDGVTRQMSQSLTMLSSYGTMILVLSHRPTARRPY